MGERPEGHTLDRINNDGNYEPSNCRWGDGPTQANNKRTNVFLTHDGETLTISQWAIKLDIKCGTLHARIRKFGVVPRVFSGSRLKRTTAGNSLKPPGQ